jgi:hypothetical protein
MKGFRVVHRTVLGLDQSPLKGIVLEVMEDGYLKIKWSNPPWELFVASTVESLKDVRVQNPIEYLKERHGL